MISIGMIQYHHYLKNYLISVDQSTAGELAVDAEGNPTEAYEWNWDTETWSKVQIL
jgi:hypothetical protein